MKSSKIVPIRVLLIDDHAIVREGVRAVCEEESGLLVVAEAANGNEALAVLQRLAVDVAILDLRMPGIPTAQLIGQMRAVAPLCNIMIFTGYADDHTLVEVIQAGAIGYLLKDVQRQELLNAIRAVAQGQPWLHHAMHSQVIQLLRRRPSIDHYAVLTLRERSVLRLLGKGLSNRQIAEALALTEGTVKGYVSNLLRKLNLTQRTQAALMVAREPVPDELSEE